MVERATSRIISGIAQFFLNAAADCNLAMRSERDSEPVLICMQLVVTARSAMVLSSVSPERWLITDVYMLRLAKSTACRCFGQVPIWLIFTSSELQMPA